MTPFRPIGADTLPSAEGSWPVRAPGHGCRSNRSREFTLLDVKNMHTFPCWTGTMPIPTAEEQGFHTPSEAVDIK